jgi:N-methylhydantoinase A
LDRGQTVSRLEKLPGFEVLFFLRYALCLPAEQVLWQAGSLPACRRQALCDSLGDRMKYEFSIEIGRKYTDASFVDDKGNTEHVKVATIPHNLMQGLSKCIEEGASRYGLAKVENLINQSRSIRLSIPTIGPDALAQKTKRRLGLIVTHPFETNVYLNEKRENPVLGFLVSRDMVVGIKEAVNSEGRQILASDGHEVQDKVRSLLEFGASAIVISLRNAPFNPINERLVREMIESDYPGHYLGAIPVFVSTDFSSTEDDVLRTHHCLLNVYVWPAVADFLTKFESYLRDLGFGGTLWVVQSDGMLVRSSQVNPLKTFTSDQATSIAAFLNPTAENGGRHEGGRNERKGRAL